MAVKNAIYLHNLHFENVNWFKELEFFKDELGSFKHRLEELVQAWTKTEVLAQAEHFQNQFIRHDEVIDELKHKIKIEEQQLAKYAKEHPIAIDHVHFKDHSSLREEVTMQRKLYSELKQEFFRYLSKYL